MTAPDDGVPSLSPQMEFLFLNRMSRCGPFDPPTLRLLLVENGKDINTRADWSPELAEFMQYLDEDIKQREAGNQEDERVSTSGDGNKAAGVEAIMERTGRLVADISGDLEELREHGRMSRAVSLAQATGLSFFATNSPLYFTGDIAAPFVLVHLNPKQDTATPPARSRLGVPEYLEDHREFGRRHYGASSPRTHRSAFDHKQIRFIRPFGVVDFIPERTREDRFTNLERVVDRKLQLELIPYGSPSFDAAPFQRDRTLLEPHMQRLLDTLTAFPREYVIFCGAVFEPLLLPRYQQGATQAFQLGKSDGSRTRSRYRFTNLTIPYPGGQLKAGLAHSFAVQGLPAEAYGEAIAALY